MKGSRLLRITRVVLGAGVILYLALGVSVLVRVIDAAVDVARGAWALFDDSGVGLDDAMVPALWDQLVWMWVATFVFWPVAAPLLMATVRRFQHDVTPGPVGAFFTVLLPGVATFGLMGLCDSVAGVVDAWLPPAPDAKATAGARISRLARWVPLSLLACGIVLFASIFAIALPPMAAKLTMLVAFLSPLAVPPLLRAWHLVLISRGLRDLDERAAMDAVRAGHAASVGA